MGEERESRGYDQEEPRRTTCASLLGALPLSLLASSSLCEPDSASAASERLRFCQRETNVSPQTDGENRYGGQDRFFVERAHLFPARLVRFSDPPLPFTVALPLPLAVSAVIRRTRPTRPCRHHHLGRERRRQAAVIEDGTAQARVAVQDVVRRLDLGLGRGEERGIFLLLGVGAEREERFVPAPRGGWGQFLLATRFGPFFFFPLDPKTEVEAPLLLTLSPCACLAASLARVRPSSPSWRVPAPASLRQ